MDVWLGGRNGEVRWQVVMIINHFPLANLPGSDSEIIKRINFSLHF